MTSRYVEIRPDNVPADGVVSFKNGFPILSFTISAQQGLLDPSSIRIVGNFNAYKNNDSTPSPVQSGDNITMNNRLGIYNIFDQLTIRSQRSKMICEQIRHYAKWFNTYSALTSSLNDQIGHMGETTLQMPSADAFRQSVMENNASGTQTTSFSAHLPCGFVQSGNMVDLRPDAFGGLQVEIDASNPSPSGSMEFNTITSLYTSINSTNAQIQYSLALRNLQSAFLTFMPVQNINTLTADGSATTYPSNASNSASGGPLANIKRVQFLKGGTKYPAEFDYNNVILDEPNTQLIDPQIVKGLYDAVVPVFHQTRTTISPENTSRDYLMGTLKEANSYTRIIDGGPVYGLGVRYGIGDAGDDFSQQQFGVSIESELDTDNPVGVYLFFKAKATLVYNQSGVQLIQ